MSDTESGSHSIDLITLRLLEKLLDLLGSEHSDANGCQVSHGAMDLGSKACYFKMHQTCADMLIVAIST